MWINILRDQKEEEEEEKNVCQQTTDKLMC